MDPNCFDTLMVFLKKNQQTTKNMQNYHMHFERENALLVLGMWSVLVVQSEQHVIYRLIGAGRPKLT